jgi:two-component system NtrC family sensor kinase
MNRTVIALVLGTTAIGLLAVVATASRAIPAEVHMAQNRVVSEVALLSEDFSALVDTLSSAWQARQVPGEAAHALANRIASSPERLRSPAAIVPGNSSQLERVRNTLAGLTQAVDNVTRLTGELLVEQTEYGASIAALRDDGPQVIQRMRELGLPRAASDTFDLVVGALEFSTNGDLDQEYELRRILATIARDQRLDTNMPAGIERLSKAVDTIITTRMEIEGKLSQLAITPVVTNAAALQSAIVDTYERSVLRTERARWLLAIYVFLLLGAVLLFGYRLRESYAAVNRANSELAMLNETLEYRVEERTAELAGTLADLKESQVQLVQAEKMSSLGQLVAGVSHEINTPLLYLANNVVLIRERLQQLQAFTQQAAAAFALHSDDFEQRADYQTALMDAWTDLKSKLQNEELDVELADALELLNDCADGLKDLSEIAQSLKDFSRLDRAPVEHFDVNAGLDKTLVIAKNLVKQKAEIIKDYGDVPEITCSPSKINQVFLNLITNAAQAMETRGTITLSTEQRDSEHVAVEIADTGCGIPADIMDKVRDPFFTTKEVGTGTGLGLSIVDEIIRSHGGRLLIESQVGKGSVFTVVLPIEFAGEEKEDDSHEANQTDDWAEAI